ncbi:MAG: DNA primase [Treponema sp.]|nr:DNA primase [Treponema sp.]
MSGYISKETIDAVNNTVDIVSIIGEYTKLTARGNDWWGCCPFHGEKTASFHVDADKKFYHCFGCGAGGNVIKFVMEQEKLSFAEAVELLAKKSGITVKYEAGYNPDKEDPKIKLIDQYIELYTRTGSMFHYLLTETEQGKGALKYIMDRGLSEETIKKFKLGYAPKERKWLKDFLLKKNFSQEFLSNSGLFSKKYPDIAFFSNRLIFPIFNRQGQMVAFGGRQLDNDPNSPKYLNSGDLLQYKKGETLYAFNFAKKAIKENKKVIFCEGYMDCIAYHQCGIEYAVAPLGTSLTEDQIKIIKPFVEEVLLSFDSDGAGQKATLRAIYMLRKASLSVRVIRIQGGKDPAEIMLNFGKEILTNSVSNAILDSDFLLSKLGREYPIDTPEGKIRASLEYFPYLDSLQSDILKESCLEQMCQAFKLKPEAVKRDYNNRDQARNRLNIRQPDKKISQPIRRNLELGCILAIIADLNKYNLIRTELSSDDFDDPFAKQLFTILEECFKADSLTLSTILSRCEDSRLSNMVTASLSEGEYSINTEETIRDAVKRIKRKSLEKQRDKIMERVKDFHCVTDSDREELSKLISEKVNLDKRIKSL